MLKSYPLPKEGDHWWILLPAFIGTFEKPEQLEQPENLEKLILSSEIISTDTIL